MAQDGPLPSYRERAKGRWRELGKSVAAGAMLGDAVVLGPFALASFAQGNTAQGLAQSAMCGFLAVKGFGWAREVWPKREADARAKSEGKRSLAEIEVTLRFRPKRPHQSSGRGGRDDHGPTGRPAGRDRTH